MWLPGSACWRRWCGSAAAPCYKGLPQFYDEQRRELERRMRKAEAELVQFADSEGVVSPTDEIAASIHTVNELQGVLRGVAASISGSEERIRAIRDQIALQPEVVKRLEINITQLTRRWSTARWTASPCCASHTEKDRHVRDNAEEIADLQAQIDTALRERPTVIAHQLFRTNPIREDRLRDLLERESQVRENAGRAGAMRTSST